MDNLVRFSQAIVTALSIAAISTASIATQAAPPSAQISTVAAATQSKVSLEQAVAIAQKSFKGSLASVGFDKYAHLRGGKYEVQIIGNNTQYEVDIDADSGKVLKSKQERLDKKDMAEYDALKQATLTLQQAIKKAAQSIGSNSVIDAEFDSDNGQAIYEIKVIKGKQIHKVIIDSMSGKVLSSRLDND